MGAHDFKLNKVPLFALKSVALQLALVPASCYICDVNLYFNVSRSAAPNIARVPASCYMCDVKQSNLKVCAKFH